MAALILKNNVFKEMRCLASGTCTRPWACSIVCGFHNATWNNKRVAGHTSSIGGMETAVRLAYISYEDMRPTTAVNQPPVIIMHEVLDSKDHWQTFAKELHSRTLRKVYAVDLRNHGESNHSNHMSYARMSADVKGFMADMKIERACLIGHGMGGHVALDVVMRYPLSVDRLVVVDASPTKISEFHMITAARLKMLRHIRLPRKYLSMTAARRRMEVLLSRHVDDDIARFIIAQNIVRATEVDGKAVLKWRINLRTISDQFPGIASPPGMSATEKCHKPVAFLHGGAEVRFTDKEVKELGQRFSKAVFIKIPGAGHYVQTQEPKLFMTFIMSFLRM